MYGQRPMSYGSTYSETETEVVRGPCDSYSSEYRVQEYGTPGYNRNHHHNHNGGFDRVTEVMSYESIPGHHHHHHGGVTEVVERRQEAIFDNTCDPYRRMC